MAGTMGTFYEFFAGAGAGMARAGLGDLSQQPSAGHSRDPLSAASS